ncbi:MAG: TIM barrel protein [Bacteroidota bacterium]
MKRRSAIKNSLLGLGTLSLAGACDTTKASTENEPAMVKKELTNNINHSVCRWCYNDYSLEQLAEGAKDIGLQSIELTTPDEWSILKNYDLTCAVGTRKNMSLTEGFNDSKNHEALQAAYIKLIDQAADAGIPSIIVFSGNKRQLTDEQGIENCAVGLDKVIKHAEQRDVLVVMELLNSKVNHPDYQCDTTPWGAALVDKIGSDQFKLLYDIYHMQIMEGDVIATIRKYKDYIGHYHTGGVPGRNELNETQELYYPAIMRAVLETGYEGYVGQEFIPTYDDQMAALKESVLVCDV